MNEEIIYKKMYLHLFNAVSDALKIVLSSPETAEAMLLKAQLDCEELYIEADT